jgi:hypothetical protein
VNSITLSRYYFFQVSGFLGPDTNPISNEYFSRRGEPWVRPGKAGEPKVSYILIIFDGKMVLVHLKESGRRKLPGAEKSSTGLNLGPQKCDSLQLANIPRFF